MRFCIAFLTCFAIASAQPGTTKHIEVPPGTQREIVLHIPPRQLLDFVDILITDPKLRVSMILPDGREMTKDNADERGFTWEMLPIDERKEDIVYAALIPGAGEHIMVGIPEQAQSGDYRVRIDSGDAAASSHLGCLIITAQKYLMTGLRSSPGVKITDEIHLPPGSRKTLKLELASNPGDAMLDISPSDPRVAVSLRFPDGTLVRRENAQENNISWESAEWPPKSSGEDYDGLWELFGLGMMLPIRGTHQMITFSGGVRLAGKYVIEVDARHASQASEIRAMFLPSSYVKTN